MIIRNYDKLKLCRTYIGGSKKEELRIFLKAQGSETGVIDWIELRRLIIRDFEDIIHVAFSRKYIAEKLSIVFIVLSLFAIFMKLNMLFIILGILSIISRLFYFYFKHKERKEANNYNVALTLTNNVIRDEIGLNLPSIQ